MNCTVIVILLQAAASFFSETNKLLFKLTSTITGYIECFRTIGKYFRKQYENSYGAQIKKHSGPSPIVLKLLEQNKEMYKYLKKKLIPEIIETLPKIIQLKIRSIFRNYKIHKVTETTEICDQKYLHTCAIASGAFKQNKIRHFLDNADNNNDSCNKVPFAVDGAIVHKRLHYLTIVY